MINEEKEEIKDNEIKKASEEQLIRLSRNTTNYVYATSKGEELSLNVAKTMNFIDSQSNPTDNFFYGVEITEDELAKAINTDRKNLHKEITKGDFLEELRTSAFINMQKNEKGEIIFAEILNAISYVKYDNGVFVIRKNPDMEQFHLNLGKNNPYYEIQKKAANNLSKHKQIELYKLIENRLSQYQYMLGMTTKWQMINDHNWRYVMIMIEDTKKATFTLGSESYKKTHVYLGFLRRQLKNISENTDLEIKVDEIKPNKRGDDAEYIIIPIKRKKDYISIAQLEEEKETYFEDKELNERFITFIETFQIEEKRVVYFKEHLIECVNRTLGGVGETIDKNIAMRILNYSLRNNYKDLYPLNKKELEADRQNREEACFRRDSEKNAKHLRDLELYHMGIDPETGERLED